MKLEFSRHGLERNSNTVSSFIKIRPVGAELFHADGQTDGQTDTSKLIVAFRNVANAPKNQQTYKRVEKYKRRCKT